MLIELCDSSGTQGIRIFKEPRFFCSQEWQACYSTLVTKLPLHPGVLYQYLPRLFENVKIIQNNSCCRIHRTALENCLSLWFVWLWIWDRVCFSAVGIFSPPLAHFLSLLRCALTPHSLLWDPKFPFIPPFFLLYPHNFARTYII